MNLKNGRRNIILLIWWFLAVIVLVSDGQLDRQLPQHSGYHAEPEMDEFEQFNSNDFNQR